MFSKMLIYIFTFLGFFAVLMLSFPTGFLVTQYEGVYQTDKVSAQAFSTANLTLYGNTGNDNATYTYSSYSDHPSAPQFSAGLPPNQFLEVWWNEYSPWNPALRYLMEFRHIEEAWFIIDYLALKDRCTFRYSDGSQVPVYQGIPLLRASDVQSNYDETQNISSFSARCDHLSVSAIFSYNLTKYSSITQSWNAGEIRFILSYEIDWNRTSISAWNLLSEIMLFRSPDLAMGEGVHNLILNSFIAIPIWIMIVILAVKIIFAFFPTSSGVQD